jgi:hypothetical protein
MKRDRAVRTLSHDHHRMQSMAQPGHSLEELRETGDVL